MKLLLDTCVLSELQHSSGNKNVKKNVSRYDEDALCISVLTIGELRKGIAKLEKSRRKQELTAWLEELRELFADHIIGIDLKCAEIWGTRTAEAAGNGVTVHAIDGLIAATAIRHGLAVVTRNDSDFEAMGVEVLNPWEG